MVPVGEPLGRSRQDGETDNFGSVVFEQVLAGEYEAHIGPLAQPLVQPPPIVTVQPGVVMRVGHAVQPQGQQITVPRGVPLSVKVIGALQTPLPGVTVRAQNTDRVTLTALEAETNARGEVLFPNVLDGVWQIDVYLHNHQRRTKQVTVKGDQPPQPVNFRLVRVR